MSLQLARLHTFFWLNHVSLHIRVASVTYWWTLRIKGQIKTFPDKKKLEDYKKWWRVKKKKEKTRKKKRRRKEKYINNKTAMNTYLSTITLNANGLILQSKDTRWLGGEENTTLTHTLSTRDSLQIKRHTDWKERDGKRYFTKMATNKKLGPWLAWLSGLRTGLRGKGLKQRAASSIPSQGTGLGCRPGPRWGCTRSNHTLMFLFLSFSPSL